MAAGRAFQIIRTAFVFAAFAGAAPAGSLKVLYSFQGPNGGDGAVPYAAPFMDSKGDLYGTTAEGGAQGFGVVYRLHRTKNGTWTETVLHAFTGGSDGGVSAGGVVVDKAGNVYGGTEYGGNPACGNGLGCGVVYELVPQGGGQGSEQVVYNFASQSGGEDGYNPLAGLIRDADGNFYGTTTKGGNASLCHFAGCGVVYEFTP
ncbi:MAG TPA: choice-of-anchor tandem repeat GloVer-containing protein [Rhizomicrobium sp.]|jgi:uncharacterized repeat protein (TIGR03803 family)|nr:choice-of-anchor tandem repeat GloVer-containing protein [Rhizomicrobium sp.]